MDGIGQSGEGYLRFQEKMGEAPQMVPTWLPLTVRGFPEKSPTTIWRYKLDSHCDSSREEPPAVSFIKSVRRQTDYSHGVVSG